MVMSLDCRRFPPKKKDKRSNKNPQKNLKIGQHNPTKKKQSTLRCSSRVSSSCPTSDTHRVTVKTTLTSSDINIMIGHQYNRSESLLRGHYNTELHLPNVIKKKFFQQTGEAMPKGWN
jgi:hypothetical protein